MHIEQFRAYCLALPFTEERTPFAGFFPNADDILVFYIGGKMFYFFAMEKFDKCTLKCEPECIAELQERYQVVGAPFNLSPKHWISVAFNADVPNPMLLDLVKSAYTLVLQKLPKKQRDQLGD